MKSLTARQWSIIAIVLLGVSLGFQLMSIGFRYMADTTPDAPDPAPTTLALDLVYPTSLDNDSASCSNDAMMMHPGEWWRRDSDDIPGLSDDDMMYMSDEDIPFVLYHVDGHCIYTVMVYDGDEVTGLYVGQGNTLAHATHALLMSHRQRN